MHISQLAHRHVTSPFEVVKEGQEVQVKILELKPVDKRVSLSIKATQEAPEQPEAFDKMPDSAEIDNPNISLKSNTMSYSLGERFGDKLSKFK